MRGGNLGAVALAAVLAAGACSADGSSHKTLGVQQYQAKVGLTLTMSDDVLLNEATTDQDPFAVAAAGADLVRFVVTEIDKSAPPPRSLRRQVTAVRQSALALRSAYRQLAACQPRPGVALPAPVASAPPGTPDCISSRVASVTTALRRYVEASRRFLRA